MFLQLLRRDNVYELKKANFPPTEKQLLTPPHDTTIVHTKCNCVKNPSAKAYYQGKLAHLIVLKLLMMFIDI